MRTLITRGFISLAKDDNGKANVQQITAMGNTAPSEIISPYGVWANPPPYALTVNFDVMGQADNKVSIAYTPDLRPIGQLPGEVAYGNPIEGTFISFPNSGDIVINNQSGVQVRITSEGEVFINAQTDLNIEAAANLNITAASISVDGPVAISGDVDITGAVATIGTLTNNGIGVGSTHTHGGVQSGGSVTSPPL